LLESFSEKSFNHITVSSGIGQARYIYHILKKDSENKNSSEELLSTAVILPDENLLIPVLQSIPEEIDKVNVTMGFPLELTPVAGLIQLIFDLRRKVRREGKQILFQHRTVKNILNHQLIVLLSGEQASKLMSQIKNQNLIYAPAEIFVCDKLLSFIFRDTESAGFVDYLIDILTELDLRLKSHRENLTVFDLESSFIYQYYITIKRFGELLQKYKERINISIDTLISIVTGLCSGITVPFVGEPLNGLQIMGVLEARGLDFGNIIIPSFNEGIFPGRSYDVSYIPYHLRKGFGLPTYELNDSIVSYNFYRLLNRAKNIFFISDNRTESGNSGEVSRFLYQLKYQYKVEINEIKPVFDISVTNTSTLEIKKDERVISKLQHFIGENTESKAFSASSLITYLNCPLNFYLKHIENFNKEDEISELIESDDFGNIFHQAMAFLYEPFIQKTVYIADIEALIKNKELINRQIIRAFNHCYYKNPIKPVQILEGSHLLIANIVFKYIIQVLDYDKTLTPYQYNDSEMNVKGYVKTKYGNVNLKGFIDRVDETHGKVRIIDYKTGKGELTFKGMEQMFELDLEKSKKPTYVFQTFLYALLYQQKTQGKNTVQPGIYYLKKIFENDFEWKLKDISEDANTEYVEDFGIYQNLFSEKLVKLIEHIFNSEIPFSQTNQLKNCEYCDFKVLCNR
jgi:acyl-CoA-binding protein